MHNHVILTGRLTHNPELRQTPSNIFVCTFSVAVQQKYSKNKPEQETDFIEIESWRGTAEFISRNFKKGDLIEITGRLKSSRWKDNDDVTHSKIVVLGECVDFAPTNNRKSDENNANNTQLEADTTSQNVSADFSEFEEIAGDDLPY